METAGSSDKSTDAGSPCGSGKEESAATRGRGGRRDADCLRKLRFGRVDVTLRTGNVGLLLQDHLARAQSIGDRGEAAAAADAGRRSTAVAAFSAVARAVTRARLASKAKYAFCTANITLCCLR